MAKKKSKKIKMVESHEAQTIGFLQRSGVPAKDIKKLIHEIHELIEFGGVSIPEAHQEVLENWHQRTALAGLRELEAELKKQTADVAKAQKRALAAAKATTTVSCSAVFRHLFATVVGGLQLHARRGERATDVRGEQLREQDGQLSQRHNRLR